MSWANLGFFRGRGRFQIKRKIGQKAVFRFFWKRFTKKMRFFGTRFT